MRNYLIACLLIFNSAICFSQEECTDRIYTDEPKKSISGCCILDVRNGNMVIYSLNDRTDSIAAIGISKDGHYVDLRKSNERSVNENVSPNENAIPRQDDDLIYPGESYRKCKKAAGVGVVLIAVGVGLEVTGFLIKANNNATEHTISVGNTYIISGLICQAAGIPIWISCSLRATHIRKKMDEAKSSKSLTLGMNNYGVGLTYRF